MAEIVLDHVTKRFPDGALAVNDVNLTIADGEFVILVGPSGCGKSTTLNMIAGLEDISDGQLRIGGEVANEKTPRDRDIGMVFQNYALYPHMSVRENMAFSLRLAKEDPARIKERVEWAAGILDLTPHLDRKPAQLSGGVRKTALGDLRLPADRGRGLDGGERDVIIGIRPEHFEDAALIGTEKRDRGATVKAKIDLLESLGSDKFAYFTVQSERATAKHLEELAADAGTGDLGSGEEGVQVTARLDAASTAAEDQELEIWVDLAKLHV